MILAIASGKGGTGKTTVSVNMAKVMNPVQLLDCDVEEPNIHLFLKGSVMEKKDVSVLIPSVDKLLCNACGECSKFCRYHAIIALKTETLVFPELCHSCGGCAQICPKQAIQEVERHIGVVETAQMDHIRLVQGKLDVGVAMATPIIKEVKKSIENNMNVILDAPPGTSCPVISTISGVDFVILVTEPTPFGLHDLKLAVEMVKKSGIRFGVLVNRMGIGDDCIHTFCKKENIPILLEIPDDRRIAEAYSKGNIIVDVLPEYRRAFEKLWSIVKDKS